MIQAYILDDGLKEIKNEEIKESLSKTIWVRSVSMTKEEAGILKDAFNLHPLTVEDLVHDKIRVKVEQFDNYLFCVFYGMRGDKKLRLAEFDFIVGQNFVITHETEKTVADMEDLKALASALKKGPEFVFHYMLDKEIDNFFHVLEKLDDEIELIQGEITKHARSRQLSKVFKLKRTLAGIRRTSFNQREKISFIAKNQYAFISKKSIPYFRDVYDHMIRVHETLDNYREALANTFDIYMSSVSNSTNEVMKLLSIFATIALPLTVISGIYGTNFAILPGSQNNVGFWVMISIMVIMSASMLLFFRKRGWLGG